MTTLTRTDTHRPSAIQPEDYEFVCFEHMKSDGIADCEYIMRQRELLRKHMQETGGAYSSHAHGGNCMVCGNAMAIYTVLFYHAKTNTYIRMGQDCADKVEMSGGDWNAFRAAVGNAIAAKAGKAKAEAVLVQAGMSAAWTLYAATDRLYKWEENTICDIVGKLVQYGSISPKQTSFIGGLLDKIQNRDKIDAERQAKKESAAPCPSGRVVVKGVVLSVKPVDSMYGIQYKVLVEADAGYKVYGSQFKVGDGYCEKGDRVEFKATLEQSKDDAKFGFFKRPTSVS